MTQKLKMALANLKAAPGSKLVVCRLDRLPPGQRAHPLREERQHAGEVDADDVGHQEQERAASARRVSHRGPQARRDQRRKERDGGTG